jgi:hypothetical protein
VIASDRAEFLSQALGLVLFFGLVTAYVRGRALIRQRRKARLYQAAGRPVPGRLRRGDAEEIASTDAWLTSMRLIEQALQGKPRQRSKRQPPRRHDPGEVRPVPPVEPAAGRAS